MIEDSLFNEDLLDITVEVMFYNENYQTGVIQAYQFLINNAGNIEKYKTSNAFFMSRYSSNYHQSSQSVRVMLILTDIVYFITLILITVKTIFKIKERVIDFVVYKVFSLEWFEALDVIILIFSYTNVAFWILIFIVFEDVTVPFANREKFDKYIAQTSNTNYF